MVTKMISALTAAVIMLFTLSAFQTVPEQNKTMSGETENMQNGENGNSDQSNTTEIMTTGEAGGLLCAYKALVPACACKRMKTRQSLHFLWLLLKQPFSCLFLPAHP